MELHFTRRLWKNKPDAKCLIPIFPVKISVKQNKTYKLFKLKSLLMFD